MSRYILFVARMLFSCWCLNLGLVILALKVAPLLSRTLQLELSSLLSVNALTDPQEIYWEKHDDSKNDQHMETVMVIVAIWMTFITYNTFLFFSFLLLLYFSFSFLGSLWPKFGIFNMLILQCGLFGSLSFVAQIFGSTLKFQHINIKPHRFRLRRSRLCQVWPEC